jgi:hypothetical protein
VSSGSTDELIVNLFADIKKFIVFAAKFCVALFWKSFYGQYLMSKASLLCLKMNRPLDI